MDDNSSDSSEPEDLAMVGTGGMLKEGFWRGSQPSEPPAAGSGRVSFLSDHWFELL